MNFLNKLEQFKSKTCLVINNEEITYKNILDYSFRISKKIKEKSLVVIICENTYEIIASYIACLNNNSIIILIDQSLNKIDLNKIINTYKSDYIFYANSDYLVSQLSTGQQKTLILLIFLAQCTYLLEVFNKKPILLLDEVCSHLDELNRKILLTLIESFDLQIFMTGTTKNLFSFLSTKSNFCNITS